MSPRGHQYFRSRQQLEPVTGDVSTGPGYAFDECVTGDGGSIFLHLLRDFTVVCGRSIQQMCGCLAIAGNGIIPADTMQLHRTGFCQERSFGIILLAASRSQTGMFVLAHEASCKCRQASKRGEQLRHEAAAQVKPQPRKYMPTLSGVRS